MGYFCFFVGPISLVGAYSYSVARNSRKEVIMRREGLEFQISLAQRPESGKPEELHSQSDRIKRYPF